MSRSALALVLVVAFTLVGFGWRTLVQLRRHGDAGWRFDRTGTDRIVGPALAAAFLLLGAGPVVALVAASPHRPGGLAPAVEGTFGAVTGIGGAVLAATAGVVTVVAQVQTGASWRIGVQAGERTELVTGGLFARVRNPIFTGMAAFGIGQALLVPNAPTIVGALVALAAIQAQVRLVEEPHLRSVHGRAYERWGARAGRFWPGVGRLREATSTSAHPLR